MSKASETKKILESLKPRTQKQQAIAGDLFLPNKSGIYNNLKAIKMSGEGSSITGLTLNQLENVETSSEEAGNILYYDGTKWTDLDKPTGFGNYKLRNTSAGGIAWDSDVTMTLAWTDVLTEGNTSSGVNPTLSNADKLLIRDSAIFIHSPTDGDLNINADDVITLSGANVIIPNSNNWKIGKQSGVRVTHTGNTSETALATITIPANTLGANGHIRITMIGTATSDASNKTFRLRWGGIAGTALTTFTVTTSTTVVDIRFIANRNAANSQIYWPGTTAITAGGASSPGTASVDTTADADLVITGQLADSTDSIHLDYYCVEYNKGNEEWE